MAAKFMLLKIQAINHRHAYFHHFVKAGVCVRVEFIRNRYVEFSLQSCLLAACQGEGAANSQEVYDHHTCELSSKWDGCKWVHCEFVEEEALPY